MAEVLQEEMPSSGSVDAGYAENHRGKLPGLGGLEQKFFGLHQEPARQAGGFGGAGFFNERAIVLPVNTGAARTDELLWRCRSQPLQQGAGAVERNLAVLIGSALVRRHRVDHPIK